MRKVRGRMSRSALFAVLALVAGAAVYALTAFPGASRPPASLNAKAPARVASATVTTVARASARGLLVRLGVPRAGERKALALPPWLGKQQLASHHGPPVPGVEPHT